MKSRYLLIIASCSALLFGAGCAGTNTPQTPPVTTTGEASSTFRVPVRASVNIQDSQFTPTSTTIQAGTLVEWTNQDNKLHTITADDTLFDSIPLATGMKFSFTFTTPGTYTYHCRIHPDMKGTIIVQ